MKRTPVFFGTVLMVGACRLTAAQAAAGSAVQFWSAPVSGHSTVWQRVESTTDASGRSLNLTNRFVQLETGLNYLDENGVWQPSVEGFQTTNNGAIAWQGQHKAALSANLNTANAVQLQMPDGQLLASHVYGLAYFDSSSGQSVMLAQVQDCLGWLYPPNQAIYTNAFDKIDADVRYTYTHGSFEQDVILRQPLPDPAQFGLNLATTSLEVWTEFDSAPAPVLQGAAITTASDGYTADLNPDQGIGFASMRLGAGRAFRSEDPDDVLALVARHWVNTSGRSFLVEAVPLPPVTNALQALPANGGQGNNHWKPTKSRLEALNRLPVKPKRQFHQKLVAVSESEQRQWNRRRGLIVDYTALNASLTNYLFRSDTTYFITGPVGLYGTNNTFEGGTVLKYANTNNAKVVANTPLTWQGALYQPVIMTASDDSSVGEKIGTNTVAGYYANTALDLEAGTANTNFTLSFLRISYAKNALLLNHGSGNTFKHIQLVNCQDGLLPTSTEAL